MFDFNNLNYWEFEVLCKDIVQKLYGVELRCFKPGRDEGVDVADVATLNSYIIQAKKYKDNFSSLLNVLKTMCLKLKK